MWIVFSVSILCDSNVLCWMLLFCKLGGGPLVWAGDSKCDTKCDTMSYQFIAGIVKRCLELVEYVMKYYSVSITDNHVLKIHISLHILYYWVGLTFKK